MKQFINAKTVLGLVLTSAVALTACSDDFLKNKKNYDTETRDIYNYYESAQSRINDLYQQSMPNIQAVQLYRFPSMRESDDLSQTTEEFTNLSNFVNPQVDMNTMTGSAQCYDWLGTNSGEYLYPSVRNINDAIEGITESILSEQEKNELLGQAYFLRAWRYYLAFRYYGGLPYVTEVQNPEASSVTPRSSSSETFELICQDLDTAAEMLYDRTVNNRWPSSEYGRITTAAVLAVKGRLMNLWASPIFNRENDPARWQAAYEFQKSALATIQASGFGFSSSTGPNAGGWAMAFLEYTNSSEGVFMTRYNNVIQDLTPDYQRNNTWEQKMRPANTLGGGGVEPSAMMVDLFPMKDGKRPASYDGYTNLEASSIAYDPQYPFMDRDPRFYRTFAFPGVYWRFYGDPNTTTGGTANPYTGDNYILWNYVWYNNPDNYDDPNSSDRYGSDNLLGNTKGIYIRKYSDDRDVNTAGKNYEFELSGKAVGFRRNATATFELRYAEVLLNLAEAACMTNNTTEAVGYLRQVRERVGYTSENNWGLQSNLGDQATCMAAILYERQIEFAYEGKRAEDMRRWLLYDGGTDFASIGSKPLTGWGGNTLTWLGFKSLVGQRREKLEFRLIDKYNYPDGESGRTWATEGTPETREATNPDLLVKEIGRAVRDEYAVDLSESAIKQQPLDEQLAHLKEFYSKYLIRKTVKGDNYDSNNMPLNISWKPRYYFLGLTQNNQTTNPTLPQTVGWEDAQNGGANGTFDPAL